MSNATKKTKYEAVYRYPFGKWLRLVAVNALYPRIHKRFSNSEIGAYINPVYYKGLEDIAKGKSVPLMLIAREITDDDTVFGPTYYFKKDHYGYYLVKEKYRETEAHNRHS